MGGDTAVLPADVEGLQGLVLQLQKEKKTLLERHSQKLSILEKEKQTLEEELQLLRHKIFGRSSERFSYEDILQGRLFDEAEGGGKQEQQSPAEESIVIAGHRRRKGGRKPLPADLPREEVIHDIAEEQKICSCGCSLVRIGEEVCEKLEIIPQKLKVIRHIRPKYACKNCDGAEGEKAVRIAPPPPQIIPKSIASPGLLAYVLVSKFCDAIPFYRQEKMFSRIGIELSRAEFCNWAVQAARQCDPLVKLFIDEIRAGPVVQMDENRVQVMKEPMSTPTSIFLFSPMNLFRFPVKKYYPKSTTPSFNRSFIR